MKLKRYTRQPVTGVEVLDAQMESYMNWKTKSRRVAESYRNWKCADRSERPIAFARYVAALDGEEAAASEYRRSLELVGGG